MCFIGISAVPQRKPKTKNASCANESVLENCLQQLFMMSGGEKQFPNSTEQVTQFCGKLKEIDTCIKGYTRKCMTPTGRRATEVAIAGVARMVKRMCKSPAKIQGFISIMLLIKFYNMYFYIFLCFYIFLFITNSRVC